MKNHKYSAILIFLLLFSVTLRAVESDPLAPYRKLMDPKLWEDRREENGWVIYSRKLESGLLGFWIRGNVKAPVESLLYILRNVEGSSEWTPSLTLKSTITDVSDIEAITYSVNSLPWPAWDRDMILHNKLFLDKKSQLLFVLTKSVVDKNYPPHKDRVRAHIEYANLGLRPVDKDTTYVEMMIYGDPRGSIPNFVVNFFQRSYPVQFLKALEKKGSTTRARMLPGVAKKLAELRRVMGPPGEIGNYSR